MKTWEKDGIVYFEEPYRATFLEWSMKVELCDSIVLKKEERTEDGCDDWIYVVAYAKKKSYNKFLREEVFPELFKKYDVDILYGCSDESGY